MQRNHQRLQNVQLPKYCTFQCGHNLHEFETVQYKKNINKCSLLVQNVK
jgi:hypothetical protein